MALGKNVRKNRESRGWDQKTLAKLSGVDVGTISALEVRNSKRSDKAADLARAFGISIEELLLGEDAASQEPASHLAEKNLSGAGVIEVPTLAQALQALAQQLHTADDLSREQAGVLLKRLASEPERAEEIAARLSATLSSGQEAQTSKWAPGAATQTQGFLPKK